MTARNSGLCCAGRACAVTMIIGGRPRPGSLPVIGRGLFPFLISENRPKEAAIAPRISLRRLPLPPDHRIYQTSGLSASAQITSVPAPLPGRRQKTKKKTPQAAKLRSEDEEEQRSAKLDLGIGAIDLLISSTLERQIRNPTVLGVYTF